MEDVRFVAKPQKQLKKRRRALLQKVFGQFKAKFPTRAECFDYIFKMTPVSIKCGACGSTDVRHGHGERTVTCRECRKKTWFIADTFFDGVRRVDAWLGAIWFKDNHVTLTACELHLLFDVAYSTALNIERKLRTVILSEMREGIAVSTALFSALYSRRSCETPRRLHPVAEQEELDNDASDHADAFDEDIPGDQVANHDTDSQDRHILNALSCQAREIYECLTEEAVHFDQLCERAGRLANEVSAALTILELEGLAQEVAGARFVRSSPKRDKRAAFAKSASAAEFGSGDKNVAETVASFIYFVFSCFKGVSRKYIQPYLAEYWCFVDKVRWRPGALLEACLRHPAITDEEVSSFLSPAIVMMVPGSLKQPA